MCQCFCTGHLLSYAATEELPLTTKILDRLLQLTEIQSCRPETGYGVGLKHKCLSALPSEFVGSILGLQRKGGGGVRVCVEVEGSRENRRLSVLKAVQSAGSLRPCHMTEREM